VFTGSYKHQLDAKNRIRIPAAYKNGMSGELIMCASANRCIGVYTKEGFEQVFSKYFTAGVFDAELQKRFTKFFSSVYTLEEDNQGRILLPEKLRSYAGIKKDVVTVGKFDRLEIWASEKLEAIEEEESFEETFDFLGRMEPK